MVGLPSVKRLPSYLRILREFKARGRYVVSTTHLAKELSLEAIVVRKDLAMTGAFGKPGVGYSITDLEDAIENFLGWRNLSDAFLVGAGNLGSAILGYAGFTGHGLNIVAAFDVDENKIGKEIHGKLVMHMSKLPEMVRRMHVNLGVLAVPESAAQEAADIMVRAGMKGIWNFTPVSLKVPDGIVSQREDLAGGLAVLSVRLARLMEKEKNKSERRAEDE